jgi:hypothetical protein
MAFRRPPQGPTSNAHFSWLRLRAGFTIEEIFNRMKINRCVLTQIKAILDFEEELAESRN